MNKKSWKRLLFLHIPNDEVGFFIFPHYYYIALCFFAAKSGASDWRQFWSSLDSRCREFIEPFMEHDEMKPTPENTLSELHEMWIMHDSEFPMTQFAEMTYGKIKSYLPMDLMEVELRTEYHEHIGVFAIKHSDVLTMHLDKAGFSMDKVASLVPIDIRNY